VRLLKTLGWEFVQNLPLLAGFVITFQLWRAGRQVPAIASAVAGSLTGSLVIRATESRIVEGHHEPWQVAVANTVGISALMVGAAAYLAAAWGSWRTDWVAGVVAGIALGALQSLAARERVSPLHCLAFACALPPVLLGVRLATATLSPWLAIPLLTAAATFIITLIDYGPLFSREMG